MAKTVLITKLEIGRIVIDPQSQTVVVEFIMADDSGFYRRPLSATFYRTQPKNYDNTPRELRENEFVMPAARAQEVVGLFQAIKTALEDRFLA